MPLVVLSVTICLDNIHLLSKKGKFEPYALIGNSTFFSKRVVSKLKRILLLFLIISFSLTTVISLITINRRLTRDQKTLQKLKSFTESLFSTIT